MGTGPYRVFYFLACRRYFLREENERAGILYYGRSFAKNLRKSKFLNSSLAMARRQLKFFADNSIFKPNMFFVELAKTDRKIFKLFLFSKKIEKNV